MKKILSYLLVLAFSVVTQDVVFANNVEVSNGMLVDQDTVSGTINVQFNIRWENSWRDTVNRDATWIFIKYSVDTGSTWSHATLKASGKNPTGFSSGTGTPVDIIVPADKKGFFVERQDNGTGTIEALGIKAVWDYKADGVTDAAANGTDTRMKIFSVEMVYVPENSFSAGDTNADRPACFKAGSAQNVPISIASENALLFNNEPNGPYYYQTGGNGGEFISGAVFTVSSAFPKGYRAFYLMKYEITQGQWVDFFNSLTDAQKITRDITSASLNGKNSDAVIKRNAVMWTSGDAGLVNSRENDRACNYLSWMDLVAYADWAALRPMTELEYEKVCRGPGSTVNDEYAWGNTTITAAGAISGAENGTETITTPQANACYNDTTFAGSGDGGKGPLRAGIFATATSNRSTAGAGYYGNMELSGDLWERCVTVGNPAGLNFIGTHGDGILTGSGNATNTDWPGIDADVSNGVTGAVGSGFKGGGWYETSLTLLTVADRTWAARTDSNRSDPGNNYWGYGGRCARTAP